MIVDFIIALLKKSRLARDSALILGVLLVIFGTYEVGQYTQRKATKLVDDAKNQVLAQVQNSIQTSTNNQTKSLQDNINQQFTSINTTMEQNNANIQKANNALDNLGPVWLRVDKVSTNPGTGNKDSTGTDTSTRSNSNGTYYAKLPDSSLQFLKGEAKRADECAVRLTAAQSDITGYLNAINNYQQIVKSALDASDLSNKK